MSYKLIDGKLISLDIKNEVKQQVLELKEKKIQPTLAVILVGNNPASTIYVKNKKIACEYTGINSESFELSEKTTQEELLKLIFELNNRKDINGILVQLPLPKHINEETVLLAISPEKDVDGFHPYNIGSMSIGKDTFLPCTPSGVIELLKRSDITIQGKNCVVIGRSNIVGKPVAQLLLTENGTVTICHSKTTNLASICVQADIIVVAIGKAKFLKADMVKQGVVIIDVGMNRLDTGKLCGDVDFEQCKELAFAITPVPGGVGPMTIAMLMKNCLKAAIKQNNNI